jgi:hypothetical protein
MDKMQLWGEAVIEHPSGINASAFAANQSDFYSSVFCLLFIVFLLLAYKDIRRSLVPIMRCCFSFSQTIKTQNNLSLEQGRNTLFIFSLFHFSLVAFFFVQLFRADLYYTYGWMIAPLFFLVFSLIYLSRWVVYAFIGWVIRHPKELTFIAQGSRDFVILSAILTLPFPLFSLFSWSTGVAPLTIWCVFALVLCYLLFLFRTLRHFLYVRFSIFFWILYLCSLEIAPLALFYSLLLTI